MLEEIAEPIETRVVCDNCENSLPTSVHRDNYNVLPGFDHVRASYCPKCPDYSLLLQDNYDEWYCDKFGRALELPF